MAGESDTLIPRAGGPADLEGPVGVLAVQGDVREHALALEAYGLTTREVRRPEDLDGIVGLSMPGGESSAMLLALGHQGLVDPLAEFLRSGAPVMATCAGLILCAKKVTHPEQRSFGVLDLEVARNGYGRQIRSGTFELETGHNAGLPHPMSGVFIRAPRITSVGPGVQVLARRGEDPVLVRQGSILAACFHPELQEGHPVTRLFVDLLTQSARPI